MDRKRARKQARQEKAFRKAEHYKIQRAQKANIKKRAFTKPSLYSSGSKTLGGPIPRKSADTTAIQKISKNDRSGSKSMNMGAKSRSVESNRSRSIMNVNMSVINNAILDDPLLAFAEKAIDEGILNSEGEFDENRMNSLFHDTKYLQEEEMSTDEEDEIRVDSDGERYLLNADSSDDDFNTDGSNADNPEINVKRATEMRLRKQASLYGSQVKEMGEYNKNPKLTSIDPRVMRSIKGLVNKLAMSNFDSIASSVVKLTLEFPRRSVMEAVNASVIESLEKEVNLLDSFVMTFSAFVAALAGLLGVDFFGRFLEDLITKYDSLSTNQSLGNLKNLTDTGGKDEEGDKVEDDESLRKIQKGRLNCITLLSHLYGLQTISSALVVGIVEECTHKLVQVGGGSRLENEAEVIIKILRLSGAQLRKDDPGVLKVMLEKVVSTLASVDEALKSSRFRFMLDAIDDLRSNRQKIILAKTQITSDIEGAKKNIRNSLKKNSNATGGEILAVSLQDIRGSKTRGKWWTIGSVWRPDESEVFVSSQLSIDSKVSADQKNDSTSGRPVGPREHQSSMIEEAAKKQRMNTDCRREIFKAMMGGQDYLDSYQRLLSLKLSSRQERDIAHVILHCLVREKHYNQFYALLGSYFMSSQHNFVVTFRYILWDRIKEIEDESVKLRDIVHIGRFYGFVIAKQRRFSIVSLKRLSFEQLNESSIIFGQVLFVSLFETLEDSPEERESLDEQLYSIFSPLLGSNKSDGSRKLFEATDDETSGDSDDEDMKMIKTKEISTLKDGVRLFFQLYLSVNSISGHGLSEIVHNVPRVMNCVQVVSRILDR